MRAGRLNRSIIIERLGVMDVDRDGVPFDIWTTVATLPAELAQVKASEVMEGGGVSLTSLITFRVRFLDGIEPTDRVRYGPRTFGIVSLTEIGRRDGLELVCSTAAADA